MLGLREPLICLTSWVGANVFQANAVSGSTALKNASQWNFNWAPRSASAGEAAQRTRKRENACSRAFFFGNCALAQVRTTPTKPPKRQRKIASCLRDEATKPEGRRPSKRLGTPGTRRCPLAGTRRGSTRTERASFCRRVGWEAERND